MRTRRSLIGGLAGIAAVTGLGINPLPGLALARPIRSWGHRQNDDSAASALSQEDVKALSLLGPVETLARWACIVDDTTNTVLLEKAAGERMTPSSLTKMMTAYVVFTFLAVGRLRLDQRLPVSEKAWRMQGSKMFVPYGGMVLVSDLIQGMLIQSGNDACIVLAEGLAGSEARFADLMNEAAGRIGLQNSHFMNSTGWPVDNHYTSARDVAVLASRLIRDFPQYYHFFGEKDFTFGKIHQGNRNVLVDKGLADGLKTGHTDAGGFGLCASALRNGRRVIVVINGMASSNERAHEGERLLGWAFDCFETVTFFRKGQVVEENVPVWMGTHRNVPLRATEDIRVTLPIGWRAQVRMSVAYPSPVAAPVVMGQHCGEVILRFPGQAERHMPLEVAESVGKLGIVGRLMVHLGREPAR